MQDSTIQQPRGFDQPNTAAPSRHTRSCGDTRLDGSCPTTVAQVLFPQEAELDTVISNSVAQFCHSQTQTLLSYARNKDDLSYACSLLPKPLPPPPPPCHQVSVPCPAASPIALVADEFKEGVQVVMQAVLTWVAKQVLAALDKVRMRAWEPSAAGVRH